MDNHLKQRLIGVIVLVTLAIIYIPMLFENQNNTAVVKPQTFIIPPIPRAASKIIIAPPIQPEITILPKNATLKTTLKNNTNIAPRTTKKKFVTEGWVIKMGAFNSQKNAENLRDTLRNAKYKAYIKYQPNNQPALYRVYVGPQLNRNKIESLRLKLLKQDFQLNDIKIVRYSPKHHK